MDNYTHKLFPYAYNILGSVEDAKDVIQDILLKYYDRPSNHIEKPLAYLIKSVINQAINYKKRQQKFSQDQIWLPEPVSTEHTDDQIIKAEILSYSLMVLLEKLTPKERAVFILNKAFHYSHQDISAAISIKIEHSRKLLSRAKNKLVTLNIPSDHWHGNDQDFQIADYIKCIQTGNVERLEQLLSTDITLYADGGAHIQVVRPITQGLNATSELILYVFQTHQSSLTIKQSEINHQPALLFYQDKKLINCQVFELNQGKVQHIYSVIDPFKLQTIPY